MAIPKANDPLDVLQQMVNDVLVQTGKALRAANKDNKNQVAQANLAIGTKIPASIEAFNDALDDLESEIVRAKAVFQRDLDLLRPAPQPEETLPDAVAPPAPMTVDVSSLGENPAPAADTIAAQAAISGGRVTKPEVKPVAPFPDMDVVYDLTLSPELALAPAVTAASKTKEIKQSPNPATAPARPASAPPRKETKVVAPQVARSANSTPKVPASVAAPAATAAPLTVPAPPPTSLPNVSNPGLGFTDMTFALVPTPTEESNPLHGDVSQPEFDLMSFAPSNNAASAVASDLTTFPAGMDGVADAADTKMTGTDASVVDEFGLDSADLANMDLDLDDSSFNEMYFTTDGGDGGEFDNAYFGLE